MKVLLDEDVPEPLVPVIRRLLRGHEVQHVRDLSWKSKKDLDLFPDARRRGFEAILTNNIGQFNDPEECKAIQRSGLHHISYQIDNGLDGLAHASASICAAIRPIVTALEPVATQRIVKIKAISARSKRFIISNPATDPPSNYWP